MKKILLISLIFLFAFNVGVYANYIGIQYGRYSLKTDESNLDTLILSTEGTTKSKIYNEFVGGIGDGNNGFSLNFLDWTFYKKLSHKENNIYLGGGIKYIVEDVNNFGISMNRTSYAFPLSIILKSNIDSKTNFKFKAELFPFGNYSMDSNLNFSPSGKFNGYAFGFDIEKSINKELNILFGYTNEDYTYGPDASEGLNNEIDAGFDGFYFGCKFLY